MQEYMPPLISSALLATAVLAGYAASRAVINERRHRKALRAKVEGYGKPAEPDAAREHLPLKARLHQLLLAILGRFGRLLLRSKERVSEDRLQLLQAGIRGRHSLSAFAGAKIILALGLPMAPVLTHLSFPLHLDSRSTLALGLMMAAVGYLLPDLWLRQRVRQRKDNLFKELPEALDLLVVCVEAGMGLDQSMSRVSAELSYSAPIVSDEFSLYNLEVVAGKSRHDALRNLSARTGLDEVNNLATLLIQADAFGTNVATTLRVFSETFRAIRFQRAQELATKIPVKIIFPTILFIMPSFLVVALGPALLLMAGFFQNLK